MNQINLGADSIKTRGPAGLDSESRAIVKVLISGGFRCEASAKNYVI